jgi:hypothetical protein
MPNSFSRFLSEEDTAQVKALYLASLQQADADLDDDDQAAVAPSFGADPAEPLVGGDEGGQ